MRGRNREEQWTILMLFTFIATVSAQCTSTNLNAQETVTVTDSLQEFTTPGYRISYYPNMACSWIFDTGRSDATIVFDIQEMLIESSRGCNYDSLSFYQGNSASGTRVQKLCGRISTGTIFTVTAQESLLVMTTDRSRHYPGAKIRYFYAVENAGSACSSPATLTATTSLQFITSPGYPVEMDAGLDCSWSISSSPGTVIFLQIIYSDMENAAGACTTQVLSLYDGTSSAAGKIAEAWCDSRLEFPSRPTVYYTTGNNAFISLTTTASASITKLGFRLDYKQNATTITTTTAAPTTTTVLVQVCSTAATKLMAESTWKYFQSYNYPIEYANNMFCTCVIEAPVGFNIMLSFEDSVIQPAENCDEGDVVVVYDGRSAAYPRMTSFCGEDTPVLNSTGRYLYIVFKTDPTSVYRGFSAKYQSFTAELPTCVAQNLLGNFTATEVPATFNSTGYPDYYNNSVTLSWLVVNPDEVKVMVLEVEEGSRLEGSVGCMFDSVKIYQGPCTTYPLLGQFCGVDRPTFEYETGSYALVVMTTDSSTTYAGFSIKYYLKDKEDDDYRAVVIVGIVVGSVLGSLAFISLVAFGVYKFLQYKKKKMFNPSSADTSRSSSASSLSDVVSRYLTIGKWKLRNFKYTK